MRFVIVLIFMGFGLNLMAQEEKGRQLFFGVNVGTKIANKNHAMRYSGLYRYFGTPKTQLEAVLYDNPINYNRIKEQLEGVDFLVPFDAYPTNVKYTPGILTGVTLGYQISPNLQVSVDGNFNKLKVRTNFTLEALDGGIQTTEAQILLGNIYAEESRFDGRFNFDYVGDGNKAKFIIGGSGLYSFWRIDEHFAEFRGLQFPLFSKFSGIPPSESNVTRGSGVGVGLNLGVEYRINEKIVSQIMYQPYQSFVNYGFTIEKRILLQHDITVRFLWK
ncbi:MAG: hypothetical protein GQ574_17410 [Crocinitomix sp.]|nr:hypothetical protein [Crocinitomix sp.]